MTAQRAWSRFMGRVFDATVEVFSLQKAFTNKGKIEIKKVFVTIFSLIYFRNQEKPL